MKAKTFKSLIDKLIKDTRSGDINWQYERFCNDIMDNEGIDIEDVDCDMFTTNINPKLTIALGDITKEDNPNFFIIIKSHHIKLGKDENNKPTASVITYNTTMRTDSNEYKEYINVNSLKKLWDTCDAIYNDSDSLQIELPIDSEDYSLDEHEANRVKLTDQLFEKYINS